MIHIKRNNYVPNIYLLLFVRQMIKLNSIYTHPSIILNNIKNKRLLEEDIYNDNNSNKRKRFDLESSPVDFFDVYSEPPMNNSKFGIPISLNVQNKKIGTENKLNDVINKIKNDINNLINDEIIINSKLLNPETTNFIVNDCSSSFDDSLLNKITIDELYLPEHLVKKRRYTHQVNDIINEETELVNKILEINNKLNKIIKLEEDNDITNIYKFKYVSTLGEGSYGKVYLVQSELNGERRAFKRILYKDKLNVYNLREIYSLLLLSMNNMMFLNIDNLNNSINTLNNSMNDYDCSFKSFNDTNNNNIIEIDKIFVGKSRIYLSFPAFNFNLRHYLNEYCYNGMNIKLVMKMVKQLLISVHKCHSHNIIHRDIKPENILISTTNCPFHNVNGSFNTDYPSKHHDYYNNNRTINDGTPYVDQVILSDFGLSREITNTNQR